MTSGTRVEDAQSGFRARHTRIVSVPISVNPDSRPSWLVKHVPSSMVTAGLLLAGLHIRVRGFVEDLLAPNRRTLNEILFSMCRKEFAPQSDSKAASPNELRAEGRGANL